MSVLSKWVDLIELRCTFGQDLNGCTTHNIKGWIEDQRRSKGFRGSINRRRRHRQFATPMRNGRNRKIARFNLG